MHSRRVHRRCVRTRSGTFCILSYVKQPFGTGIDPALLLRSHLPSNTTFNELNVDLLVQVTHNQFASQLPIPETVGIVEWCTGTYSPPTYNPALYMELITYAYATGSLPSPDHDPVRQPPGTFLHRRPHLLRLPRDRRPSGDRVGGALRLHEVLRMVSVLYFVYTWCGVLLIRISQESVRVSRSPTRWGSSFTL